MNTLSITEGFLLVALFGVGMVLLVLTRTRTERHLDGFLVADRSIPAWQGAFSIAVSWVWAPAIFVCSMQAFNMGLPGLFWFTAPNILCFFVFAPMAKRLRHLLPRGYTFPEYIAERFDGHRGAHLAFLLGYFLTMVGAIVANAYAGGTLLAEMTSMQVHVAILLISVISLAYSLISGLKASIFTDVVQMSMVLLFAFVLVPSVFFALDNAPARLLNSLSGISGEHGSVFDAGVAFTMGIPMTITLITGPLADQMFVQRAMAVEQHRISKTFTLGGLLFGLIPLSLSLLGFLGVSLAREGAIVVSNPEMIGPLVISHTLPTIALYAFALMALAALCSTLDSALCAVSSLASIDIYRRYVSPKAPEQTVCRVARTSMIIASVLGTAIALCRPNMMWTFLIAGCITGALYIPAIFALYSRRVSPSALVLGICISIFVCVPFAIYANIVGDSNLVVWAALSSLVPGLVCGVASLLWRPGPVTLAVGAEVVSSTTPEER